MPSSSDLGRVRLLQIPLDVHARAVQWHEDLMREFALISIAEARNAEAGEGLTDVPARLLKVVADLRTRYASPADAATEQFEEARKRGETTVDVTYTVPMEAAEHMGRFRELLDEADEFCRNGDLLTLAAQPELAAFRRWYLSEFVDQLRGEEPTPWPVWSAPHGQPS